jgi:cytochrome d ubiquinol oxidase subunit II
MEGLWYAILAAMLTAYVILDGFDFGAGIIHMRIAKTDEERRMILQAIGPVWDANEVWLISSGALLFFAFPRVYASAFSGFYLPLMIVLWLLVGRGLAIDWRSHVRNPLWRGFGDAVFTITGWLLAIVLGAALGNLIRGLPIEANGYFWSPLWTDFRTAPKVGALDWYTVTVAAFTLSVLAQHGALYLAWKTEGPLRARARRTAGQAWFGVLVLGIIVTIATAGVRTDLYPNLLGRPWAWPLAILVPLGLAGIFSFSRRGREFEAFLSSAALIAGLLGATAAGIYPSILRSTIDPAYTLTAHNAAAGPHGLRVGLVAWCIAMPLVVSYFVRLFRSFRGRVASGEEGY